MKKYSIKGLAAVAVLALPLGARAADAPDTWTKNCASCHGADGAGKTRAGKMVGAKDLTDAAYQKTFTDDQAFKAIKDGYKDETGKDKMKPFSAKLSDDDIKALVAYCRAVSK